MYTNCLEPSHYYYALEYPVQWGVMYLVITNFIVSWHVTVINDKEHVSEDWQTKASCICVNCVMGDKFLAQSFTLSSHLFMWGEW